MPQSWPCGSQIAVKKNELLTNFDIHRSILQRCSYEKCSEITFEIIIYSNRTSAWVFSSKFASYFQNNFLQKHLWGTASVWLLRTGRSPARIPLMRSTRFWDNLITKLPVTFGSNMIKSSDLHQASETAPSQVPQSWPWGTQIINFKNGTKETRPLLRGVPEKS